MKIELIKVKEVLILYGVSLTPSDDALIQHMIDKVSQHIINETNQPSVPKGAYEVAIDMICGEFMQLKYAMGQLDIDDLNFDINVSSVSRVRDGDTDVTYGTAADGSGGSPLSRFNNWLNSLNHPEYDWGIWRRLRW